MVDMPRLGDSDGIPDDDETSMVEYEILPVFPSALLLHRDKREELPLSYPTLYNLIYTVHYIFTSTD